MPRQSGADLARIRVNGRPARLLPPRQLSADARRLFVDLTAAVEPEHFSAADLPLLCQYVEALALAERASRELRRAPVVSRKPSPWLVVAEKCWRATATLATKLRLAPQARYDARQAGRRAQGLRPSILDDLPGGDE
jgi:hypothetical protein